MRNRTASGPAKHISAAEAAALVKPGNWVDYGLGISQTDVFDTALAERMGELSNVHVRGCLSVRPRAILEKDTHGRVFEWWNWHFSGYDRTKHDVGRCGYIPLNLGEVPDYYRRFLPRTDIAVFKARPKDKNGYYNFGPTHVWQRAVVETAKVIIVEVTPTLPHANGVECGIHESEVDFVIDGNELPTPELRNPAPNEIDHTIANRVLGEVEDGACVQIGIGAMPNAACTLIAQSGIKDLGIHTEMLTDGIIDLVKAGRVTGAQKKLNPGKVVYTFALGSKAMYDTLDGNDLFEAHAVDYTNMPHLIMQNDKVVSINNTTQIDLQGQCASESDGHRHLTGTGGQLQFVRGAYASKGGKSFMLLASTYERKGQRKSRIVLDLTPGNIVTTPRSDTMYVVTEYGIANLKGKSVAERAKALIGLAHPDFREELERQAYEKRLIPRRVAG
jgi:acyl-CoA hydrolase